MKHYIPLMAMLFNIAVANCQESTHRIIVKIKPGVVYQVNYAEKRIVTSNPNLAYAINASQLSGITSLVSPAMLANTSLTQLDLVKDIHFFDIQPGANINMVKEILESSGAFTYVENDHHGTGSGVKAVNPNDNYFSRQWGLLNNGTFNGFALAGADVKMTDAWTLSTGSSSVIVCILDSGLKLDHPEFAGRLWVNPGEIPGNGIDDDNNGFIDDINGWDWANNDSNPTDDHGHGTNVAGIAVASGNNNNGYAGVDWNCKIMTGKILNSANSGAYSWFTSGIMYAVSKGARVINMSVGGASFSQAMKDACDFAYANNVAVFACMMNVNNSVPYYPAAYSSTIAIGATDVNDYRVQPFFWDATSGSNFGSHIDLVAPGNFIYGLSHTSNTNYNSYWGGTSQATPLVAGVGSLMIALQPTITVNEIRDKLKATATDLVGKPVEDLPGFDIYMGAGRMNALAALSSVLPVSMSKLQGIIVKDQVLLNWKTFTERNTDRFIIEFSSDISNWKQAGQVSSKGTSNTETAYHFIHESPLPGSSFYRLKQVDMDGKFEYSNIVRIINTTPSFQVVISAPVTGILRLSIHSTLADNLKLALINATGAVINKWNSKVVEGNNNLQLNIPTLPSGTYSLVCEGFTGEKQVLRFIKY